MGKKTTYVTDQASSEKANSNRKGFVLTCSTMSTLGLSKHKQPARRKISFPTTSQGYVLPEGETMANTIFVGEIDISMDETEIQNFFTCHGTVKEVKIITDRTGVCKGYGFVLFLDNINVQKIVESLINFHGKKLKLGPAIRKYPKLCVYDVSLRPMLINSPIPQFHSVWSNQETYMQSGAVMSPVSQYVQAYTYGPPALLIQQQIPVIFQPSYTYQVPPHLFG